MCARRSPVLLSGDGHTSVRGRREAPRDEAGLCWQLLLQLLCIFQFHVQRRAAIRSSCSSAAIFFALHAVHMTLSLSGLRHAFSTRASHERSRSALS